MNLLDGFAGLASRYDGFVLDLWGVIHDGVRPYPGAVDCLERLQAAGKRCVMLSNAPRRARVAVDMLHSMGIGPTLYTAVVTSGEATFLSLQTPPDAWFAELGQRVFHLGPERDRSVIEGLGITRVDVPGEASFVLNTGPDDHLGAAELSEFEDLLRECARHALPMICANPDLEVIRGGVRVLCAGALAVRYGELGGSVRSIGKPDPAIYGPVLALLGCPRTRTLAVGDSLRTDIAGAVAAGIDACWVLGGIHGEALGEDPSAALEALSAAGLSPVAMLRSFTW